MSKGMRQVRIFRLKAIVMILGAPVLGFALLSAPGCQPTTPSLPSAGPRVPIPTVAAATLVQGVQVWRREACFSCHNMTTASTPTGHGSAPGLLHEGRRNADISWQMSNLRQHSRIHPNSDMPDYDNLSNSDLVALASFMATRK